MYSVKGFGGVADTFLNMAEGIWSEMRDTHDLVGQEDGGWDKKLPCNQFLQCGSRSCQQICRIECSRTPMPVGSN